MALIYTTNPTATQINRADELWAKEPRYLEIVSVKTCHFDRGGVSYTVALL